MNSEQWYLAADRLLAHSRAINGCDTKRRYCCSYHQGFEDGIDLLITEMEREPNA